MSTQAEYFSNIFGTEKDSNNCPFFYKCGACKYGEKCNRMHYKPKFSRTILIPNFYLKAESNFVSHFEDFYEDVFLEFSSYGKIDDLIVCCNVTNHLKGCVFLKYFNLEAAQIAMKMLRGRYYGGILLKPEFSAVTEFDMAKCKQFEMGKCTHDLNKGCNFWHVGKLSQSFEDKLWKAVRGVSPKKRSRTRSSSQFRSRYQQNSRSRGYSRSFTRRRREIGRNCNEKSYVSYPRNEKRKRRRDRNDRNERDFKRRKR